jgi:hypothetical protein
MFLMQNRLFASFFYRLNGMTWNEEDAMWSQLIPFVPILYFQIEKIQFEFIFHSLSMPFAF